MEKDKCECQAFLKKIGVPTVETYGSWRPSNWNRQEFRELLANVEFPVIIKLGHIQQSIGLKVFKSKEKTLNTISEVEKWIERGMPELSRCSGGHGTATQRVRILGATLPNPFRED